MIRKQTKVWTTKDGRRVRICDMADQHLANVIRRNAEVQRARNSVFYLTCPEPSGDGAQACFETEQEHALEHATWHDHVHELHEPMVLDYERRGLDPDALEDPTSRNLDLELFGKLMKVYKG